MKGTALFNIFVLTLLTLKIYSQGKQKLTFERPNYAGETISYEGAVINGKANGYGEATTSYQHRYKGYWKDNDFHGKGVLYFAGGDVYDGEWKNGERTANCIMTYKNGNTYTGEWLNNSMHGKGKYTWGSGGANSGDVYDGDFVNNEMHGKATYIWKNGDKYTGDWVRGVRTGKGIFIWSNTGSFKGHKYEGDFLNNVFTGKASYTWPNGDVYNGDWLNGVRTGKSVWIGADGKQLSGDWVNNTYQYPAVHAKPAEPLVTSFTEPYEINIAEKLPKAANSIERASLMNSYLNNLFTASLSENEKKNRLAAKIVQLRDIDFYALYEYYLLGVKQNEMPKMLLYMKAAKEVLTEQQYQALFTGYNINKIKTSGGAVVYNQTTGQTSTINEAAWDANLPFQGMDGEKQAAAIKYPIRHL